MVNTDIHHPSDSTLRGDGIRVLCRTRGKARQLLGTATDLGREAFGDRTRSARRLVKRIMQAARKPGEPAQQTMRSAYQKLLQVTDAVLEQAQRVGTALEQQATERANHLRQELACFVPRVKQVIAQTTQRVLQGHSVPATQKLVSLFEPHTAVIRKGKPACPVEFGRVVWLDEVDGGLISRFEVLVGNPPEQDQIKPSLDHHVTLFQKPPRLLAGDRGTFSPAGESYAAEAGVTHVVLPKPGARSAARKEHERQPWLRRGRNFRAGIEGRIRVLGRDLGLERCLYHGQAGMERWVGWGVLAHDLRQIARATAS